MSEVRNIHYMTKEYLDSLNFPDVVIEELDKAGKHLSIVSKEQRQMTREHAKKILTHLRNGKSDLMLMDALDMAISALSENKGEWIKIQSGDKDFPESIVCSKCKNENSHLDFNEHAEPIGKVFVTSKFCPNCGADMRGE